MASALWFVQVAGGIWSVTAAILEKPSAGAAAEAPGVQVSDTAKVVVPSESAARDGFANGEQMVQPQAYSGRRLIRKEIVEPREPPLAIQQLHSSNVVGNETSNGQTNSVQSNATNIVERSFESQSPKAAFASGAVVAQHQEEHRQRQTAAAAAAATAAAACWPPTPSGSCDAAGWDSAYIWVGPIPCTNAIFCACCRGACYRGARYRGAWCSSASGWGCSHRRRQPGCGSSATGRCNSGSRPHTACAATRLPASSWHRSSASARRFSSSDDSGHNRRPDSHGGEQ